MLDQSQFNRLQTTISMVLIDPTLHAVNQPVESMLPADHKVTRTPNYAQCVERRITSILQAANTVYRLILDDYEAKLSPSITNYACQRTLVKSPIETLKYTVSNLVLHLANIYKEQHHHYKSNDPELYITELLKMAEGFQTMIKPRAHQYTVSHYQQLTIIQHDSPLTAWSNDQLDELYQLIMGQQCANETVNLNCLDQLQQKLLRNYLNYYVEGIQDKDEIKFMLSKLSIPSHIRHVVGLANHSYHQLAIIKRAQTAIEYFAPQLRSAHPSHQALKGQVGDALVTQRWLKDNLRHTLVNALANFDHDKLAQRIDHKGQLIYFVQTLTGKYFREDARLDHDLREVISEMDSYINGAQSTDSCPELFDLLQKHHIKNIKFVTTSHPINLEGNIASDHSHIIVNEICSMSKHSLSSKTLAANEALKTKFYRSSFQWLYRDIPYFSHLWSAALEQLAMKELGITTGFCVSGKDRRAIVLMLTDALDIFYTQYDRLPKFLTEGQNQDYDELADLFAHIYCTYHHQHNSAYNAPGVFALKNAYMYLPTKFKANITQIMVKEDALTCDDELASINDIAKLYDRHYVVSDHLACRQWQALNLLKFAVENWFTVPNRPVNVHNDLVSKINRVLQSASNAYWFRFYDELVDNDQTNTDSLLPGQYPCLWQLVKLLHGAVQSESDQFRDEKIAIDNLANTFRQNYIADSDASNDMTPKPNLSELYLTIKSIIEERSLWCEAQPFFLRFFSGRQADIKNNNVAKPIKVLQQTIAQLESPVAYQGGVSLFNDQFKLLLLKKLGKELKQKQMWLDNNCLYLFCSGLAHIDVNNVQASLHFFQSFLYDHQPFEDSNRLDAGLNNECSL